MKFIKGTFDTKFDDLKNSKVRLTMSDGFSESPWVGLSTGDTETKMVLLNDALTLLPFPSWGMLLDKKGQINMEEISKQAERTFHPEAFDQYLEHGVIDAEGNFIARKG